MHFKSAFKGIQCVGLPESGGSELSVVTVSISIIAIRYKSTGES